MNVGEGVNSGSIFPGMETVKTWMVEMHSHEGKL